MALKAIGLDHLAKPWLGDQKLHYLPYLFRFYGNMWVSYAAYVCRNQINFSEFREAAKIDGATEWQISRYIIIPILKPVIKICVIFAVTGSLKAFDLIYVLTNGGPAHASEVPSTLMVSMILNVIYMDLAVPLQCLLFSFASSLP